MTVDGHADALPAARRRVATNLDRVRGESCRTGLAIEREVERVLEVTEAAVGTGWHRIGKVDNVHTVAVNIRQWNQEMDSTAGRAVWARRSVRYFAFDPASGMFAPTKFCAFIPAPDTPGGARPFTGVHESPGGMTNRLYASLGEADPRFDGHVARKHLESRLAYTVVGLHEAPGAVRDAFLRWRQAVALETLNREDSTLSLLLPRIRR